MVGLQWGSTSVGCVAVMWLCALMFMRRIHDVVVTHKSTVCVDIGLFDLDICLWMTTLVTRVIARRALFHSVLSLISAIGGVL
jgi:hypothetical protein